MNLQKQHIYNFYTHKSIGVHEVHKMKIDGEIIHYILRDNNEQLVQWNKDLNVFQI